MERYKGYQVPISSIRVGTLLDRLSTMEKLSLADIVDSNKSKDVPTGAKYSSNSEDLLAALDKAIGLTESDDEPEVGAVETTSETEEAEEDTDGPVRRRRRKRTEAKKFLAARTADETETPDDAKTPNHFIELTKLLPPVPKKGNFEVNTIKNSLYFFS
jgi:DNA-directed RNA polymerase, mitochondrial